MVGEVISGTGIRKFVDSLPGLGPANANNLGQYIPVAIPDTTTYPGSDYYEIALVEYTEQMHSRPAPDQAAGLCADQYGTDPDELSTCAEPLSGTLIIAKKDRPVRIKFTNMLAHGRRGRPLHAGGHHRHGGGDGSRRGRLSYYTQNRATLHLHGGITPWISDGTPHQWITPAGETTSYPEGRQRAERPRHAGSRATGSLTFYYTNQQSARLMFYHDHAYGITRLNVYAGEAAGYLLTDPAEQSLINAGSHP